MLDAGNATDLFSLKTAAEVRAAHGLFVVAAYYSAALWLHLKSPRQRAYGAIGLTLSIAVLVYSTTVLPSGRVSILFSLYGGIAYVVLILGVQVILRECGVLLKEMAAAKTWQLLVGLPGAAVYLAIAGILVYGYILLLPALSSLSRFIVAVAGLIVLRRILGAKNPGAMLARGILSLLALAGIVIGGAMLASWLASLSSLTLVALLVSVVVANFVFLALLERQPAAPRPKNGKAVERAPQARAHITSSTARQPRR